MVQKRYVQRTAVDGALHRLNEWHHHKISNCARASEFPDRISHSSSDAGEAECRFNRLINSVCGVFAAEESIEIY